MQCFKQSAFQMTDDFDLIRRSGTIFRDLGHPDADRERLGALLAVAR
jgi:hypothetical protein